MTLLCVQFNPLSPQRGWHAQWLHAKSASLCDYTPSPLAITGYGNVIDEQVTSLHYHLSLSHLRELLYAKPRLTLPPALKHLETHLTSVQFAHPAIITTAEGARQPALCYVTLSGEQLRLTTNGKQTIISPTGIYDPHKLLHASHVEVRPGPHAFPFHIRGLP